MGLVPQAALEALERAVQEALRSGDPRGLELLGYGEITTVVRLRVEGRAFACKRLAPFPDAEAARRTADCIRSYVEALEGHGVDVLETELGLVAGEGGSVVVHCVQPALPAEALGPAHLHGLAPDEGARCAERIFERLRGAVTPRLAPDGQLSNWAFPGDRLVYLDVSTPFLRDERGRERFDFQHETRALPLPLRVVVDRFLLAGILESYYSLRGQARDFLGNLEKERLGAWIPRLLPLANRVLALDPPLSREEVARHYARDARTYAAIQAARRADRWWQRRVLRRPYPYLLPPRIERHEGAHRPGRGG